MIEPYLIGSVGQSLERIRQLRQIVQRTYRREYDGLRQICLTRLDVAQAAFQSEYQAWEAAQFEVLRTPVNAKQ